MEKKEYIVPSIRIIDVLASHMVCTSVEIADGYISGSGGRVQERRDTWGDPWAEDGEVD